MTRLLVLASLSLLACGPGAKLSGKEGAAQALLAAASPSTKSNGGMGIDLPVSITVGCPQGGKVTLGGFKLVADPGNAAQAFNLTYQDCGAAKADVGVAIFNGSLALEQAAMVGTGTANVEQKLKGKVLVQGAFDDFLDADITQSVSVSALGSTGGTVSVSLLGTITTSTATHTFDGTAMTITAGTIKSELPKRM